MSAQQSNVKGDVLDDVDDDVQDDVQDCWDLPRWSADSFDLARELRTNSRLHREDVAKLKAWVERQRSLPRMREADLVKFLHSTDYDVFAAEQCIKCYCKSRASMPSVFFARDTRLAAVRAQLDVLDFAVMPRCTPDGCRVVVNRLRDPDPNHYEFEDSQKVFMMMIDAMLLAEPTLPGVYIIYDAENALLSHFWKFGFFIQRKLFSYFQAGFPLILKGFILLHTPSYISTVMKVLRSVGDKKRLDETALLQGHDYTPLHRIISKDCLPSDYGGNLPSRRELHDLTIERLDSLRDYFDQEEAAFKRK